MPYSEIAHPLAIRANTSDVMNFRQIFLHQEYGFEFPYVPRRILDLGAYAGYAAVFFANRFPTAQIACLEPSTANFKILAINTQAYDNIEIIPGAAWHRPTFLAMSGNVGGHWGTTFSEQSTQTSKLVRAYTVNELMDNLNWPDIDLLKCDIEGAELELFSAPDAPEWLERVHIASVETHDRFDRVPLPRWKERFVLHHSSGSKAENSTFTGECPNVATPAANRSLARSSCFRTTSSFSHSICATSRPRNGASC